MIFRQDDFHRDCDHVSGQTAGRDIDDYGKISFPYTAAPNMYNMSRLMNERRSRNFSLEARGDVPIEIRFKGKTIRNIAQAAWTFSGQVLSVTFLGGRGGIYTYNFPSGTQFCAWERGFKDRPNNQQEKNDMSEATNKPTEPSVTDDVKAISEIVARRCAKLDLTNPIIVGGLGLAAYAVLTDEERRGVVDGALKRFMGKARAILKLVSD